MQTVHKRLINAPLAGGRIEHGLVLGAIAAARPATLESVASFRVKTAALSRPAAPLRADPNMVLITNADGGGGVYPPGDKLVSLPARSAAGYRQ